MQILHVYFNVKLDKIEKFIEISKENSENSINETGVIAFEVLQEQGNSSKFVFNEVYETPEDHLKHRETEHFKKWKSVVGELLLEPYTALKYNRI